MRPVALISMLLASSPTWANIGGGDHLFLYARLIECPDEEHIVDYAEVPDSGEADFIRTKIQLTVLGLEPPEVASLIAKRIGAETGTEPQTSRLEVISDSETD